MTTYNNEDQWSEIKPVLQSITYQAYLAIRAVKWMRDEGLSRDGLLDAMIIEICVLNQADLFDYKRIYIDLDQRPIDADLPDDTRHAIGRLIEKAKIRPRQRLHAKLIEFYMWVDLAIKCRDARMGRTASG